MKVRVFFACGHHDAIFYEEIRLLRLEGVKMQVLQNTPFSPQAQCFWRDTKQDMTSIEPIATVTSAQLEPEPHIASTGVLATQRVALLALLALIVLCVGWELSWAPIKPGGSWLALKALPLALPVAGFLKRRLYTFRWVSLIVWLYFIEGVVRAYSDPAPACQMAGLEILLCLVLFMSCALHVKYRFKAARTAVEPSAEPTSVTN